MLNAAVFLFGMILLRMTGAIVFHPVFGRSNIPALVKAAFIFVLSLVVFVWNQASLDHIPVGVPDFLIMAMKELLIGFCMGFGVELAFMVFQFAGSVIDFSMGLSMAQMYDPQTGTQMSVSTYVYSALCTLLFFQQNGHIRFLDLVFRTYSYIPAGGAVVAEGLPEFVLRYFTTCIVMGLQLAIPIAGIELMTEIAIGFMMRVVPQINIFVVSFQIKLIVGMAMILLLLSPMAARVTDLYEGMFDMLYGMIGLLH